MSIVISDLEQTQLDIQHFLLSHEQLQYLPILRVRPRNDAEASGLQTKLDKLLAGTEGRNGKAGVSVIITMPSVEDLEANIRSLTGKLIITIDVIENLFINEGLEGTGASCESWALLIAQLLQQQQFISGAPIVGEPKLLTPFQEALIDKKVMYRLHFVVPYMASRMPKVAVPAPQQDGDSITLTCTTEGAAIYYTLDRSLPGPGNPAALAYSVPLTLEPGTHYLRAAAFAPAMAGSNILSARLTVGA